MSIRIICNNHERELIEWFDLTEREQQELDYINTDDKRLDFAGFRYKGHVYDLGEFMRVEQGGPLAGWDGYASDSFFSGVCVRLIGGEHVVVGTYLC